MPAATKDSGLGGYVAPANAATWKKVRVSTTKR
jgi:hypothetical protein